MSRLLRPALWWLIAICAFVGFARTVHGQTSGTITSTPPGGTSVSGNTAWLRGSYTGGTAWAYTVTTTVTTGSNHGGGVDGVAMDATYSGGSSSLGTAANPAPNSATNTPVYIGPNLVVSWKMRTNWGGSYSAYGPTYTFTTPAAPAQRRGFVDTEVNNSDFVMHVTYTDTQTGAILGEVDVAPHTQFPMTINSYNGHDVTTQATYMGAVLTGGVLVPSVGGTYSPTSQIIPYANMTDLNGVASDVPAPFVGVSLGGTGVPTYLQPQVGQGTVAHTAPPIFTAAQTGSTAAATNGTVASAANQTTAAIVSAIWESGKANKVTVSGGGGGGDATAANQVTGNGKLDTLHTDLTAGTVATTTGDMPTVGTETPLVVPTSSPLPTSAPAFFTGSLGSSSTISASLPAFTIAGKTWPASTFTYDISPHSTPVGYFRALCSVVLWVLFFGLLARTTKAGVAN